MATLAGRRSGVVGNAYKTCAGVYRPRRFRARNVGKDKAGRRGASTIPEGDTKFCALARRGSMPLIVCMMPQSGFRPRLVTPGALLLAGFRLRPECLEIGLQR